MRLYEDLQAAVRRRGAEYELDGKEPLFLCEAHTEADIDVTLEAMAEAVKEARR
jgi:glutamate-1-semialdehyde aminotransferase